MMFRARDLRELLALGFILLGVAGGKNAFGRRSQDGAQRRDIVFGRRIDQGLGGRFRRIEAALRRLRRAFGGWRLALSRWLLAKDRHDRDSKKQCENFETQLSSSSAATAVESTAATAAAGIRPRRIRLPPKCPTRIRDRSACASRLRSGFRQTRYDCRAQARNFRPRAPRKHCHDHCWRCRGSLGRLETPLRPGIRPLRRSEPQRRDSVRDTQAMRWIVRPDVAEAAMEIGESEAVEEIGIQDYPAAKPIGSPSPAPAAPQSPASAEIEAEIDAGPEAKSHVDARDKGAAGNSRSPADPTPRPGL